MTPTGGLPRGLGALEGTASSHSLGVIDNADSILSTQTTCVMPAARTTLSERAKKRAAIGDKVGSNDKPTGLVRETIDGSLEYFLEKDNIWIPAVTRDEIRSALIEEYNTQGQYVRRPQALRQIFPTRKAITGKAKLWYRNGKIVLDPDDRPIRLLDIPAVCSSRMEDWLITAMFLSDAQIEILDIRARMPRTITVIEKGRQVHRPLFLPNALSMPVAKREKNLKTFLGEERVKKNSLAGFEILTKEQIVQVEAVNKGNFGYRARTENKLGKRKEPASGVEMVPKKRAKAPRTRNPIVPATMTDFGKLSGTQEMLTFQSRLGDCTYGQVPGRRVQESDPAFHLNHVDELGFLSNLDPYILTGRNTFGITDQPLDLENHTCRMQSQISYTEGPRCISDHSNTGLLANKGPDASILGGSCVGEGHFAGAFDENEHGALDGDSAFDIVSQVELKSDIRIEIGKTRYNSTWKALPPWSATNAAAGGDGNKDIGGWWTRDGPEYPLLPISPTINGVARSGHRGNEPDFSNDHYSGAKTLNHMAMAYASDQQANKSTPSTDTPSTEAIGRVDGSSVDANGWAADELLGIGDLLFKYAPRPLFDFDNV
ncbi:hypothetical protein MMC18_006328 [Xylographa bjoerkii]|nr:hypothetical protein [Xylographa bjoerkii]